MAHIPQPAAGAGLPTTEIRSTDSIPTEPSISGIGTPGPNPAEIPEHSGAQNFLDPYLYRQWITCATISWTTQLQPGTLLWDVPVTPTVHPILRVLSTIYNVWGGPMEFMMKLCGTGFHAGLVCAARIPPNFHPIDFAGAGKGFTAFEYVLIDPKMLEPAEISVRDQRQVEYHYVVPEGGSPSSWDIGGHLALYVMDSLVTSSTGANQIQIEILVRAGQGFQFSQIVIPRPRDIDRALNFPNTLSAALNFYNYRGTMNIAGAPKICDRIEVQPSDIKELLDYRYNCFNFAGQPSSENQFGGMTPLGYGFTATVTSPDGTSARLVFQEGFWDAKHYTEKLLLVQDDKTFFCSVSSIEQKPLAWNIGEIQQVYPVEAPTPIKAGKVTFGYIQTSQMTSWIKESVAVTAMTAEESIILFTAAYSYKVKSMQPFEFARLLSTKEYANVIPANHVALLQIVKKDDNLPLAYVKLYHSGLMTTSATKAQILYSADDIAFEFIEYMPRTNKPPSNPTMATNRMLYSLTSSSALAIGASAAVGAGTALGTQAMANANQQKTLDRGEQSFTKAGLPSYLYYSSGNNSMQLPDKAVNLGGSNYQIISQGYNRNPDPISNDSQQIFKTNSPRRVQNFVQSSDSLNNQFSGQTDRVGLGAGRYSTVPPPSNFPNMISVGIDARPRTAPGYSQTSGLSRDSYSQTYNPPRVIYPSRR